MAALPSWYGDGNICVIPCDVWGDGCDDEHECASFPTGQDGEYESQLSVCLPL